MNKEEYIKKYGAPAYKKHEEQEVKEGGEFYGLLNRCSGVSK